MRAERISLAIRDHQTAVADDWQHAEHVRELHRWFGIFDREFCLYPVQKFESDPERRLAVILEREAEKWFRPAREQFQIYYKVGRDQQDYQPDFVAETGDTIYMLESKARSDMNDADVLAKRNAAVKCASLRRPMPHRTEVSLGATRLSRMTSSLTT